MSSEPEVENAVPVPLTQRLNDFRLQVIPVLVFSVTLALIVSLWSTHVTPPTMQDERGVAEVDVSEPDVTSGSDQIRARPESTAKKPVALHPPSLHGYTTDR